MKLSQIYAIVGWPLRFWRTETLPPAPVAHSISFEEAVRIGLARQPAPIDLIGNQWRWEDGDRAKLRRLAPRRDAERADIEKRLAAQTAMDVRYNSLKQGESLGRLTAQEQMELNHMETGHGWCTDFNPARPPERNGHRIAYFP
jgi:hypothetical protein